MSNTLITVILGAYLVGFLGTAIFMYFTMGIERILEQRIKDLEEAVSTTYETLLELERRITQ